MPYDEYKLAMQKLEKLVKKQIYTIKKVELKEKFKKNKELLLTKKINL